MINYKQILLEFENDTIFKTSSIVSMLLDLYPELGNEVVLPIDMVSEKEANVPVFYFEQNDNFKIYCNFYNFTLIVAEDYINKIEKIIAEVIDIFNNFNIKFVGMAYTIEQEENKKKIEILKNKFINPYDTRDSDELFLNFVRYFKNSGFEIRCLEGYSTLDNRFLTHFEFNTKVTESTVIDYDSFYNLYKNLNIYLKEKEI